MWFYIVDTLKVLANVFFSFVIVVTLIVLAWIILWKLILSQVSFIREIAGLPKLNNNISPQQHQTPPYKKKKKRQSSISSFTTQSTHSRQQSITSTTTTTTTHSKHHSPSHNRQQSTSTRIQQHNNINTNNPIIHQRTFSSSTTNQYQDGGSEPMSGKTSSINKTYQSQDDTSRKNHNHTKSDSRTSIKSVSSGKILPIENDELLNFKEGYIS